MSKKKLVKMVKPDGSRILVHPEDVDHRKTLGWKIWEDWKKEQAEKKGSNEGKDKKTS